jgi:lipopolysaccharide transport system ATP-binding protein
MHLRLAFSAAIHMNPDILVVDEVFAVGDLSFREKCIQLLEQFRRAGKTLILASHEMGQIERSCDDAIVLEEGTLQFRSSPDRAVEFYYDLLRRNAEVRAMKNSGEGKVEQPPVGRRLGTQEARISQVRFYDHQGCQNTNFVSGGEITIEMEVQFAKSLSDFGLAVAIFSEANVKCLEVHIQSIRKIVDSWKENSKFHCRLPHLHLLPGHYYANVGIYPTDWNCIYDYHWQMHPFRITGEFPNVAGVISVQPDWSAL